MCGALLASICLLSTTLLQTVADLVEQFQSTTVFWEQFEVAKKIVNLHDKSVLPQLEPWLRCEDMHRRGNAAFVFARLGDDRGFQVIYAVLEDRSPKRAVFEIDSAGHPSLARQIRADRYYAAHLLGVREGCAGRSHSRSLVEGRRRQGGRSLVVGRNWR